MTSWYCKFFIARTVEVNEQKKSCEIVFADICAVMCLNTHACIRGRPRISLALSVNLLKVPFIHWFIYSFRALPQHLSKTRRHFQASCCNIEEFLKCLQKFLNVGRSCMQRSSLNEHADLKQGYSRLMTGPLKNIFHWSAGNGNNKFTSRRFLQPTKPEMA